MINIPDYASLLNWAIGMMINGELPWFCHKTSKYIGRTMATALFAVYFVIVVWLYDAWLIPGINAVMSIRLVWKMAVKAAILLYKKEWNLRRWYYESLSKSLRHPYVQFGIRL